MTTLFTLVSIATPSTRLRCIFCRFCLSRYLAFCYFFINWFVQELNMPPKKKGGGKGGKKGGGGYVIDGVSTTEMSREQLEVFALRLREELEREREERNFFQIERDKLRTFWEITRKQLEECQAQIKNKDRILDAAQMQHHEELKKSKQRVKHLLYENQTNLMESKAENMISLRQAEDHFGHQERELLETQRDLKHKLREANIQFLKETRNRKLSQSEEISKLREKYDVKYREMELKYEQRLIEQRKQLEFKHRVEIAEVEERKNNHINTLISNHDELFAVTKLYYNGITLNNLSLLSGLKDQTTVLKKREEQLQRQISELEETNKSLIEPLQKAEAQVADLNRKMKNYKKDQLSLQHTKSRLAGVTAELDNLKWENEVLENRFIQVQEERNELRAHFKSALIDIQAHNSMKNVLLEKKLKSLSELLETKEAQIADMIASSHLEPGTVASVHKNFEELVARKNKAISKLQYQLTRVCKAHDDLLVTYEEKLERMGISKEERGFDTLRGIQLKGKQRSGPAGIVSSSR